MTDLEKLERRLADSGQSPGVLYPIGYRVLRKLGVAVKPPLLQSLGEHYLYCVPILVICMAALMTVSRWATGSPEFELAPIVTVSAVVPVAGWWRYRRLRRKIEID